MGFAFDYCNLCGLPFNVMYDDCPSYEWMQKAIIEIGTTKVNAIQIDDYSHFEINRDVFDDLPIETKDFLTSTKDAIEHKGNKTNINYFIISDVFKRLKPKINIFHQHCENRHDIIKVKSLYKRIKKFQEQDFDIDLFIIEQDLLFLLKQPT
jgi:hypothetical protein